MGEAVKSRRQFGEGPLSRVVALVYSLLVVELLVVVAILPGAIPLLLLDRDASNIPLFAVCVLPVGPAISAALYALRNRSRDITDLGPAAAFWRGYRMNLAGVLRIWVPWLIWASVIAVNLAHFSAAHVPAWWAVLLVLILAVATLWGVNALVITSLFAFRAIDVARLAVYFLARTPGVTLGNLGLLIVAAGVTAYWSDAVLALLSSVLVLAVLGTSRPMIVKVQNEFTA
jgi:hypothetical protein